jgi:hypothetical protein
MKKNELVIDIPELKGIEKSKAEKIRKTFEPMTKMLVEFEGAYEDVIKEAKKEITPDLMAQAKRLRLDISKVRIDAEKARKAQKEEYLRAGKAIDGVNNILKWAVTEKEDNLREIEEHFLRAEKARMDALQAERVEQLSPYVEDAAERTLWDMEDDVWDAYLTAKKSAYQDKVDAEKKVEEERKKKEEEERIENERIRKENEKLAKQNVKKEAKAKEEREKRIEAERKLKQKEKEEQRLKEEEEQRIEDELKKGDADKVQDLIADLEALKTKYTFKSKKNKKMGEDVAELLDKTINYINKFTGLI